MKRIIYFLILLATLSSCKDEETAFQPAVGAEAFSFKPMPGGAIMHFKFPADKDLMGLNIRYKDYAGHDILRTSSALKDSVVLEGFNEAKQNVPAEVRFVKRDGEESAPIAVSFSTEDSAPYAFFNNVKVLSGWNGFSILTDNTTNAKGMAHIYYLGTDPLSGQPDTILIKTVNITEGKDTLNFELKQKSEDNTIVIRTEDYRGYMVREQAWSHVKAYNTDKLEKSNFDFYFDKSVERPDYCMGEKYLFDGELKGIDFFDQYQKEGSKAAIKRNCFLAGPQAWGDPMYIDMHQNRLTAEVRFYTPLNVRSYFDWCYGNTTIDNYYTLFKNGYYIDKLPCSVDVYAAKDDNGTAGNWDEKAWVKVASYDQDPDIETRERWIANAVGNINAIDTKAEAEEADSVYMPLKLLCEQGEGYRYLKIVVNKTYNDIDNMMSWSQGTSINAAHYFLLQELEVWTKKDE